MAVLVKKRGLFRPEPSTPKNLRDAMESCGGKGYMPKAVFCVLLSHGLMATCPIVFSDLFNEKGENIMLLTPHLDLLCKIWSELTPKKSAIQSEIYLVNAKQGVGFRISGESEVNMEQPPYKILTWDEFNERKPTFRWAGNVVGTPDISKQRFTTLIESERQRVAQSMTAKVATDASK